MIIYGAGDQGRILLSSLKELKIPVHGFFDDNFSSETLMNLPVLKYSENVFAESKIIIAIGDNFARKCVADKVKHVFTKVLDRSANISTEAIVSTGSMVMAGAIVQCYSHIGKHTLLNSGSVVEHDCQVGNFVHIAPNSTLCGRVAIGDMSLIGAGSIVLPGIKIGKNCIVGAGSVVLNDVDDNVVVAGNPAKILKKVKID